MTLNGFQMFARENATRLGISLPLRLNPPALAPLASGSISFIRRLPLRFILFFVDNADAWTTDADQVGIVAIAGYTTDTRQRSTSRLRRLATLPGNPPLGYPGPIIAPDPFPLDPAENPRGFIRILDTS